MLTKPLLKINPKIINYLKTIKVLFEIDLIEFKSIFIDKLINSAIFVTIGTVIMGYILPMSLDFTNNFALFMFSGAVASLGFIEIYPNTSNLLFDLSTSRRITYELLLPVPSWIIFIQKVTFFASRITFLAIFILIYGKLIIVKDFPLFKINLFLLFFLLFIVNFLMGSLSILFVGLIKDIRKISIIWNRFINPIWLIGGYQFAWAFANKSLPALSYFILFTPMIYPNEAFRGLFMNHPIFISIYKCIPMIIIFTILSFVIGFKKIKKFLDFI